MSGHASNFTPGPWTLLRDDESEDYTIQAPTPDDFGVYSIATITFGFEGEFEDQQHANANLLFAAPDLLAAASHAKEVLTHAVPYSCWATGPKTGDAIEDLVVCPGCRTIAEIDAAIAKATGAQP
jgi:hypothetical protein